MDSTLVLTGCLDQRVGIISEVKQTVGFKNFSSHFRNFYLLIRRRTGENRLYSNDNRLLIRGSRNQNLARGLN